MVEELSPESKLFVKEEIEKLRKEFEQDIKEAQSKATKTFTVVALIIGLLASVGVLKLAKDHANEVLSDTTIKTIVADANELKDSCKESLDEATSYVEKIKSLTENYETVGIYVHYTEGPYREICHRDDEVKGWTKCAEKHQPYFYAFVKKTE
ncbi:MAG: hypothetical protein ACFFCW_36540 [Candidatus Hodarchaeota archaeon]